MRGILMNKKFKILLSLSVFLITSCAPPPGGDASFLSSVGPFLPFGLIIILFYFLIIRPQNKQQKQRELMLKNLKQSDKILTNGGIIGKIIEIKQEDIILLEISKGVQINVKREFINSLLIEDKK
tara:strand:- start:14 stop:388 length:375 start_codon:yes stop_codon:yes gene_type:complete